MHVLILGGGSCNFQPCFRGGSVIFVPKGGGGPCVFYQPHFQMLRPSPPPPPPYFLTSALSNAGVGVIRVPPWYVYPRTHITSDMCTPGHPR